MMSQLGSERAQRSLKQKIWNSCGRCEPSNECDPHMKRLAESDLSDLQKLAVGSPRASTLKTFKCGRRWSMTMMCVGRCLIPAKCANCSMTAETFLLTTTIEQSLERKICWKEAKIVCRIGNYSRKCLTSMGKATQKKKMLAVGNVILATNSSICSKHMKASSLI